MRIVNVIACLLAFCGLVSAHADDATLNVAWGEQAFADDGMPPFSFVYDGKPSAEFLATWKRALTEEADDGLKRRTLSFTCPDTGFEVKAVCTVYTETPGVDWTLYFTNRGDADSAVLENVNALDTSVALADANAVAVLHQLRGSTAVATDWQPFDMPIGPGQRVDIVPQSGRSSKEACPFFTCLWPGGGVVTAIGWTVSVARGGVQRQRHAQRRSGPPATARHAQTGRDDSRSSHHATLLVRGRPLARVQRVPADHAALHHAPGRRATGHAAHRARDHRVL